MPLLPIPPGDLFSPGRALAQRARAEETYLSKLRGMLRHTDLAAQDWASIGLTLEEAVQAKTGNTRDEIAQAVESLSTKVRTNATRHFNETRMAAASLHADKRWVARLDGRTRETHVQLNGQVVHLHSAFEVAGMRVHYPGDRSAPPELSMNCRCVLVFSAPLDYRPPSYQRRPRGAAMTAAADVETYKFNPDQLRVPKGFGQLSGRWIDMPGKVLDSILGHGSNTDDDDDDEELLAPSDFTNFVPATPELRAAVKAKFGKSIPPGLKDVVVNLDSKTAIAKGIARNGKPQYVYTAEREQAMAARKFVRVRALNAVSPKLEEHLANPQDGTDHALRFMYFYGVRVGSSDKQMGKVKAYAATTITKEHVTATETGFKVDFVAKEGIPVSYEFDEADDPVMVGFLRERMADDTPLSDKLFQSNDTKTQDRLKQVTGIDGVKNHDLRTLLANRIAFLMVQQAALDGTVETPADLMALQKKVYAAVAEQLRNTPAQAKNSYINPVVFAPFVNLSASKKAVPEPVTAAALLESLDRFIASTGTLRSVNREGVS